MGYRQIANVFGPLMVDETTGALLVDAGGGKQFIDTEISPGRMLLAIFAFE